MKAANSRLDGWSLDFLEKNLKESYGIPRKHADGPGA